MLYFPNDVHYLEKIKGVRFKEICILFNLRFAAKVEHKIAALSKIPSLVWKIVARSK